MPPSVDEWLPEKHLARFVVEVADGLNLSAMSKNYRGSGSASYHPAVLLSLLVYGCATGMFSSRKLERAAYDSVAFRFIAANDHPDHDTIATFRRRFLKEIEALFVQILLLAREIGVLNMGTVALDGTKITPTPGATARYPMNMQARSKSTESGRGRSAAKAEAADQADIPDAMSLPEELARRGKRLETLAAARATIEARAKERFEREQTRIPGKGRRTGGKAVATGKNPWQATPAAVEVRCHGPGQSDRRRVAHHAVAGGGSISATTRRPWWPRAACWW